jgi:hypothetical protein
VSGKRVTRRHPRPARLDVARPPWGRRVGKSNAHPRPQSRPVTTVLAVITTTTSPQELSAATLMGHVTAAGLLPGGGAASAVIGTSIIVGLFAGVVALEIRRNLFGGMVVGFVASVVVLTLLHAAFVA